MSKLLDLINTNETTKKLPFDFEKSCRITSMTKIKPITASITIDNSIVCTEGGILVVSGQKKAGKSNGIVNVLATALMQDVNINETLLIRSNYTEKKIIYIDTEQHKSTTQSFINKIKRIARIEKDPDNLIMYNITEIGDSTGKWDAICQFVLSQDNIGLLVIDGVADIVKSVNDEEKAKEIVDILLSKIGNMSIVVTIHEGKDNNGATGHLGQVFEKKCTGTVAFFKDRKKGIHKMVCKMLRHSGDFDDVAFKWCETAKGFVLLTDIEVESMQETKAEQDNRDMVNLMKLIYAISTELSKEELIISLKKNDKKLNLSAQPASIAKSITRRIQKAIDLGIIDLTNDNNYKFLLK